MGVGAIERDGVTVWSCKAAEFRLRQITGVESVRIVEEGTRIQEIHVFASPGVLPKKIVKDIESALVVDFNKRIDHRTVSIAQSEPAPAAPPTVQPERKPPTRVRGGRLVLLGHRVVEEPSRRMGIRVSVEWQGRTFDGTATGADVAHSRLEALATATLRAVELAAREARTDRPDEVSLDLDGVAVVGGREQPAVLVSVLATKLGEVTPLAGAVGADGNEDRAAILATLQATDRWIRGQITC